MEACLKSTFPNVSTKQMTSLIAFTPIEIRFFEICNKSTSVVNKLLTTEAVHRSCSQKLLIKLNFGEEFGINFKEKLQDLMGKPVANKV